MIPLRPPDRMRPTDSWTHIIATGSDSLKYYEQLHKCKYLHEWCNQRWGTMHMSWEAFNKYSDTSLSARVRLIYWLRRIWYTYHPECDKHVPRGTTHCFDVTFVTLDKMTGGRLVVTLGLPWPSGGLKKKLKYLLRFRVMYQSLTT